MTRGLSVKERNTKKKRVFTRARGGHRVVSKVLSVVDALKEDEHFTPPKRITQPYKVVHFVRRSPQLFKVCRDNRGFMWTGLSPQAKALVEEEAHLLEG
ncbi:hypothetical protein GUJ93_ZPchr0738g18694 [Zizania palustris]|nr:hypothetical protein GUJ93_ZPchr0738g18694 [Zizania palustris]